MVTNDERRRVAAALRECLDGKVCLHNWRKTILETVAEAVGMTAEDGPTAQDFCDRLADLIDPDTATGQTRGKTKSQDISPSVSLCDREALLALAEKAEKNAWYFALDHDEDELRDRLIEAAEDFSDVVRRIRDACGVTGDA